MATRKKNNRSSKGSNKTYAAKRTMNPRLAPGKQSARGTFKGGQEHDTDRRLGSFEGKGEHARTGNRGHQ